MARSANTATMNTVKEPEELSVWSHCGWTMTVDPRLRGELCDDLRTLRLFHEACELSLSSNRFDRTDGGPAHAEDILGWFPPPNLVGDRFAHDDGEHVGRAVWIAVPGETSPGTWLLVALTLHRASLRGAQMTFVFGRAEARDEALAVWRSVRYDPDEGARTAGVTPSPRRL